MKTIRSLLYHSSWKTYLTWCYCGECLFRILQFHDCRLDNTFRTFFFCVFSWLFLKLITTLPRQDPSRQNEELRARCVCLLLECRHIQCLAFQSCHSAACRRRVFHSQARSIIYNAIKFCDAEKTTGLFLPLSKTIECAAAIVKLNKETNRKEGKECVETSTPNKVRRPPANKVELDDMDNCIIRREVHKYYNLYKELSTLRKLHKFCKRR